MVISGCKLWRSWTSPSYARCHRSAEAYRLGKTCPRRRHDVPAGRDATQIGYLGAVSSHLDQT